MKAVTVRRYAQLHKRVAGGKAPAPPQGWWQMSDEALLGVLHYFISQSLILLALFSAEPANASELEVKPASVIYNTKCQSKMADFYAVENVDFYGVQFG